MKSALLTFAACLLVLSYAHAQDGLLVEIDKGRTEGIVTKTPVFQRAILLKPDKPTDTAVLFFRGFPGIARIQSAADTQRNLLPFMKMNQQLLLEEGIALVIMDCPTDQWGATGPFPTACDDSYRSSGEHANDVRSVMVKLKDEHGLSKFYLLGHSMGTISSRWLAKNLGDEIAGSIHSAAVNGSNPRGYGNSLSRFPYNTIAAPLLHVHNEGDACRGTPYSIVKGYAGENLLTVRGGVPAGDPCGGGHLHSHQGREALVVRSIITWIKTGKFERLIGD